MALPIGNSQHWSQPRLAQGLPASFLFETNTSSPHHGAAVKARQHAAILMNLQMRLLPGSHSCTGSTAGLGGSAQPAAIVKRKHQKQGDFHSSPPRQRYRRMACGKAVQSLRRRAGEINDSKMISPANQCCESHSVLIAATAAAATGAGHSPSAARPCSGVSRMRNSHW